MDNQDRLTQATRAVNVRLRLYIHLTAFILVNALLVAINLAASPQYLWFFWPLLGWGLGILLHVLLIVGLSKGAEIKSRMIERELSKRPPSDEPSISGS